MQTRRPIVQVNECACVDNIDNLISVTAAVNSYVRSIGISVLCKKTDL